MVKWEYRTVTIEAGHDWEIDKKLNSYGEDGWEVAGLSRVSLDARNIKVVLKRPKAENMTS